MMQMLSFSFNGIRKDYVHMLRGRKRPPWPSLTRNILTVPGRPGGYLQGTEIQPRIIEVPIAIRGQNIGDLQKLKEDLASWLVTDEPKELVFDDEPDRTYYAVVDETIDFDEIAYLGQGTVRFLCPDPFKYGPLRTQTINVPPASFSRNSVAYLSDGTQVSANQPRFESGGVLIEEGTVNLLQNPSFETDSNGDGVADNWIKWGTGTYSIDSSTKRIGGKSQKCVNTTSDDGGIWQGINCSAGQTFTFSAYFNITSLATSAKVRMSVEFYDVNNSRLRSDFFEITRTTSGFERFTKTATAPTGAVQARAVIHFINGVIAFVDDAQLEQKPYATSFVDGTRQPETLTLPTAGVLLTDEGTIEMEVEVPLVANWNNFFSMPINNGRFLLFFDSNGKVRFDYGAHNLGSSSPNGVMSPNAKTFIAMRWSKSQNKMALFVNGTKYETALPSGIADSFPDTVSVVNNYSAKLYNLRLSRIARSDAEILDAYQNGFTVDEYTTAYLDFENNLEVQTPTIVVNEGTAETYPTFTAYVKQPITFLDIVAPDGYMRVGQPYEVSQTPVDGDKPVMQDKMTTTTGWGAATSVVDGIVQGTMVSDGERFVVQSYGPTYNGWAGPALKKSLPYPIEDFRMYSLVQIHANEKGTGRVEIYGLDTTNNIVFRATIADFWQNTRMVRLQCELGTSRDMAWMTYGKKKGDLNYYYGAINIRRKGNLWEFYTARVNNEGNLVDFVRHTFTDTKNKYTAPLAQLQVHIGCHMSYGPVDHLSINHLYVYELRDHQENQVPYIAYPDDVLQFDHKNAVIYRNGEPIMWAKDFGASFFALKSGATELAVNPSDAAVVTIDYRPRYK